MPENASADSWSHALDDLVALIDHPLPVPSPWIEDGSREEVDDARAVAVAWGWLMRTKRSAQAVLGLDRLGFGVEAAPLACSVMEHAVRLLWAARHARREAVAVLLSADAEQAAGGGSPAGAPWALIESELRKLGELHDDDALVGPGERAGGDLNRLRWVALGLPDGEAGLYGLWEKALRESHPTLESAAPYLEQSADRHGWLLRLLPQTRESVFDAQIAALLLAAFEAYVRLAGLEERFGPRIDALGARMMSLRA
ncbi:hypothetical protein RBS60_04750 [Sinomonas sp. ASV486]|uniref:hypothetical protein n=1 Tax=Sinomonas sp. ASV486 TaxID=3051170 RepID=UPI0027DDFF49|nr:hypothetical protein [Sinomonas sp. ASV486]MDQ4489508.1 hypothetical protein [Sinomonas sp. ASV486]